MINNSKDLYGMHAVGEGHLEVAESMQGGLYVALLNEKGQVIKDIEYEYASKEKN